jgi:hypothetical protein
MFILKVIYEYVELRWNDIDRENRVIQRKTFPSASLSTINLVWTDTSANPVFRGEKPATNHLSYGTA